MHRILLFTILLILLLGCEDGGYDGGYQKIDTKTPQLENFTSRGVPGTYRGTYQEIYYGNEKQGPIELKVFEGLCDVQIISSTERCLLPGSSANMRVGGKGITFSGPHEPYNPDCFMAATCEFNGHGQTLNCIHPVSSGPVNNNDAVYRGGFVVNKM